MSRVRKGEAVVLDIRPEEEYLAGHLPGAVSMPLGALRKRLSELSKKREIVAYCRGPYCIFAIDAVKILRARGFKAWRMADGMAEWRAQGLPVEAGNKKVTT